MRLTSPVFDENQEIPQTYTCEGKNVNPPLEIHEIPQGTQSLALIVDDPDAPGGIFTHWMMWNIPPDTSEISENFQSVDTGEQGMNGRARVGYTGPCPPSGVHHYHFKLFALSKKLDVTPNISKQELENEIDQGFIEKAELVGLYSKKN